MYRAAVIMSTYNGEKFLRAQIDSILTQKDVEVSLYIRDDGSTSPQVKGILDEYLSRKNVFVSYGANIGVGRSFMECLYGVPEHYDYYAFADQDDVWLSKKLIIGIQKLQEDAEALLYASNQTVTDKELNYIRDRFEKAPGIGYCNILRGNEISGCTFIFPRKLYQILIKEDNRPSVELMKLRMHDVWVALIAAMNGKIIFDMNSYILYRQHGYNVVGVRDELWINKLRLKIKRLVNQSRTNCGISTAKYLIEKYGTSLSKYYNATYCYATYRKNQQSKRKMLGMYEWFGQRNESRVSYLVKLLLNRL